MKWDSSGCEMRYRSGEKLPVFLQDGCPMLPRERGMELLREVEEYHRRRIKLRLAVINPQPDQDREEVLVRRAAQLFTHVPIYLVERVIGKVDYDTNIMGINRKIRRQVERAETVILNLFAGENTKIWTTHGKKGLVFLNVEVKKGADVNNIHLFGWLESQARFGRFDAMLAGPPCRTVSFCRFNHRIDGGPPPVRARDGRARVGLPNISEAQKKEVDNDTVLWLKTLWLIHLGSSCRRDMKVLVEQPQDPLDYREDDRNIHWRVWISLLLGVARDGSSDGHHSGHWICQALPRSNRPQAKEANVPHHQHGRNPAVAWSS